MPTATDAPTTVLLAEDHRQGFRPAHPLIDRPRRGAVAVRAPGGRWRRAEPGPSGPILLELLPLADGCAIQVWGPVGTARGVVDDAVTAAWRWAGRDDDPAPLAALVADHPLLGELYRRLGAPRLSCLPRVGEAVGRAVIAQLVQAVEAHRSTSQVAALCGTAASDGLWCWPTAQQLGNTPAFRLRRCGVSLRGAGALHGAAVHDGALTRCGRDWSRLDARLRALPGVGVWTSASARADLGDPDAVPVGDYNLPGFVGHCLGGDGTRTDWDDDDLLELLAPFSGERWRVIQLLKAGVSAGLIRRPRRRAPRAAVSHHRYW